VSSAVLTTPKISPSPSLSKRGSSSPFVKGGQEGFGRFLLAKGIIVRILQRIAKKKVAGPEECKNPGNLHSMEGP